MRHSEWALLCALTPVEAQRCVGQDLGNAGSWLCQSRGKFHPWFVQRSCVWQSDTFVTCCSDGRCFWLSGREPWPLRASAWGADYS